MKASVKRFEAFLDKHPKIKYFKIVIDEFFDDDIPGLAAQLTFYLITAFFPFLIFVFTIVSYTPLISEDVIFNLFSALPEQTYNIIVDALKGITRSMPILIISTLIALWSMSSAINTIAKALNKFYDVEEDRNFIVIRVWGIFFAICIVLAIILNFILLVLGTVIGKYITIGFGDHSNMWNLLRISTSLVVVGVLFAVIYKIMPNRHLKFKNVIIGALFASFSLGVASAGFSYYVNNVSRHHIIYGSIGGLIALITWIYMTSYIILLGADLNAIIAGYRKRKRLDKLEGK